MSTFPAQPLQAHLAEAIAHLAAGELTQAKAALDQARAQAPRNPQVHLLLAEVTLAAGDRPTALAHAAASLGFERKRPEPFALLGRLVHEEGNSALGARLLERALALEPGMPAAQEALAALLRRPVATASHPTLEPLGRRPTVSLCLIVKDESRHLARCLRSAAPHVDEVVVVDTGSTDGTQVLAEALGAHVLRFPWVDDFAAARNHALEQASGDWALVLDADEELEAPLGYLQAVLAALPWPDATGVVPLVSLQLYNHAGSVIARDPWEPMAIPRLFPRAAVRYFGAAHESPGLADSHQACELVPMTAYGLEVHHHGYQPEVSLGRDKLQRNIALLRKRMAAAPGDHGLCYLLGRELVIAGEAEAGLAALARYEAAVAPDQRRFSFRLTAYFQAEALKALGRGPEAIAVLEHALLLDPHYPSYHFALGEHLAAAERFDEAIARYERAIANADYPQRHPLTSYNATIPRHAGTFARERAERARRLRDGVPEPSHGPLARAIADAMTALDDGQLAEASRLLAKATGLAPTNSQARYLQAEVAFREGDVAGALALAFAALQLGPGIAQVWALLGYLLHEDEDSGLGAACLERAVALDAGLVSAQHLLRQARACPRGRYRHAAIAAWVQSALG